MVERLKVRGRLGAIFWRTCSGLIDVFQSIVIVEELNQGFSPLVPLKLCWLGGNVSERVGIAGAQLRKLF